MKPLLCGVGPLALAVPAFFAVNRAASITSITRISYKEPTYLRAVNEYLVGAWVRDKNLLDPEMILGLLGKLLD